MNIITTEKKESVSNRNHEPEDKNSQHVTLLVDPILKPVKAYKVQYIYSFKTLMGQQLHPVASALDKTNT